MAARRNVERLLDLLADDLVKKLESGEATAADLNVARQFLKDNAINCLPTKDNSLGKLVDTLPFQTSAELADEEYPN